MNDYRKSFTVNKSSGEVYTAVTKHIPDWWSNDLAGAAAKAGDSFTIAFGKTRKTFDIVKTADNELVVWKCVKAHIDMASLKDKAEWEGTMLTWTMSAADTGTTVGFLHEGLNKNLECYEVCEAGWDYFLSSLEAYISTGKGSPFVKKPQPVV